MTQKPHFVVRVVVPLALPKRLDYAWQGENPPEIGQFVAVEVGRQRLHGLVAEVVPQASVESLKPALPLPVPPLVADTNTFIHWSARYNMAFPGEGLRAMLLSGEVPEPPAPPQGVILGSQTPAKLTPQRQKILALATQTPVPVAQLATLAGVSDSTVRSLIKAGALALVPMEEAPPAATTPKIVDLSPDQQAAAGQIIHALDAHQFKPFVLDGVTGSGKTEVYFAALEHLLHTQPTAQALVLVPEISLTPQWVERFEKRLGFTPAVWHSNIADGARRKRWRQVMDGTARVVVGARSALFLPYKHLAFVVVDEEHDPSYKQEEGFRYHGRDMAITRAHLAKCPVVLASATPSLETWHHAHSGKYTLLHLPQRHGGATLPPVHVLDLKATPPAPGTFLSPPLLEVLRATFEKGQQSLLFLNRRGFAPLLICRACGHRVECPSCTATLVVHGSRLQCHHCGFTEPKPDACPKCHAEGTMHAFGPGTRRIVAEVQAALPKARIAVADRDSMEGENQMASLITRMEAGEVDVLVGTQMIAKGHHFPNLTMVGVVDADMGLAQGDLRAAERTFQLLTQVSGRAGRAESPGHVWLQTHQPEHPLFQALKTYDRDAFYHLELQSRRSGGYPPFGRLVALILSGPVEAEVLHGSQTLARHAPDVQGLRLFGPAPAPLAKVRDRYRYRLLLQSRDAAHGVIADWLSKVPLPSRVRVDVDVDPQSFY